MQNSKAWKLFLALTVLAACQMVFGCSSGDDPESDADMNDECVIGESECLDDNRLRVCEAGSDGTEWSAPEECASDERCQDGDCVENAGECETGTSECVNELTFRVCEGEDGDAAWGEPVDCEPRTMCHEGECVAPELTSRQEGWLEAVDELIAAMENQCAWIDDIDYDAEALQDAAFWHIALGEETERTFYEALWDTHLAFPVGHQALYSEAACGTADLYWQSVSRLGVCARPAGDDFVVTHVTADNPLELQPGDLITAVDGVVGDEMYEMVLRYPVCGAAAASADGARILAATSLFSSIPVGTTLDVQRISDGTTEVLEVPNSPEMPLECRDPMGRNLWFDAESYLRPDGVGVVRLPRLFPLGHDFDEPYEELFDAMQGAILDAFEPVADASALVWDLRANGGGLTVVGYSVVEGMPGIEHTYISTCGYRIPGSSPVELAEGSIADYVVSPGPLFNYDGPVAVLVDGLAISAGDYFVRAAGLATEAIIVGTGSAGGYGSSGAQVELGSDPSFTVYIDPYRCSNEDDVALEGRVFEPDIFVEQEPEDMAAGLDTQLEAAVAAVLAE